MPDIDLDDGDAVARRASRLAEIMDELTTANRALSPAMSEASFHAMVQRMAEQQLLYEEFGSQR
jgi:hypothetical protein